MCDVVSRGSLLLTACVLVGVVLGVCVRGVGDGIWDVVGICVGV